MPFAYEEISGFAIHNHIIQFSLQSSFAPLTFPMGGNSGQFCSKPLAFIKCAIRFLNSFFDEINNLYSQSYSQLRFRSGIDLVYFILEMLEFMF